MNYLLVGLPTECKSPSKRREVATFNAGEEQPDDVRKRLWQMMLSMTMARWTMACPGGEPRREKRRQEIKRLQTRKVPDNGYLSPGHGEFQ